MVENSRFNTILAYVVLTVWVLLMGFQFWLLCEFRAQQPIGTGGIEDSPLKTFFGGTTLFSVGARYVTQLAGRRTTWQMNIDNALEKRYWAGAGTRLAAGLPRTVKLTAKVDW